MRQTEGELLNFPDPKGGHGVKAVSAYVDPHMISRPEKMVKGGAAGKSVSVYDSMLSAHTLQLWHSLTGRDRFTVNQQCLCQQTYCSLKERRLSTATEPDVGQKCRPEGVKNQLQVLFLSAMTKEDIR